ncbi:MAG: DNA polymerase II, partial [Treponema sp.]|nr:DNA polymerase II [Treponema sp.]
MGRLEDGRSFAAAIHLSNVGFHISQGDIPRCAALLSSSAYRVLPPRLRPFSGTEELAFLQFDSLGDRTQAYRRLFNNKIFSPDGNEKPAETFLMEKQIHGWMEISGQARPGHSVDLVFAEPRIRAADAVPAAAGAVVAPILTAADAALRLASIDIETDTRQGTILAIGVAWTYAQSLDGKDSEIIQGRKLRVLGTGKAAATDTPAIIFHPDEASLLRSFIADIRDIDPDVLTGWNFLDFDFKQIAERCAHHHIPLLLGRSDDDEAKYFPPPNKGGGAFWGRGSSATALVPGRQVLDALRIIRAGGRNILVAADEGPSDSYRGSFSLEAVSRRVLGEGKLVASSGEDKIAELEKLYIEDIEQFALYCLRDAELVLRILAATGLFRLTVERANLTAV